MLVNKLHRVISGRGFGLGALPRDSGRPPPPPQLSFSNRTCENFKSVEILRGGEASSVALLRYNQYYYVCMCITLL